VAIASAMAAAAASAPFPPHVAAEADRRRPPRRPMRQGHPGRAHFAPPPAPCRRAWTRGHCGRRVEGEPLVWCGSRRPSGSVERSVFFLSVSRWLPRADPGRGTPRLWGRPGLSPMPPCNAPPRRNRPTAVRVGRGKRGGGHARRPVSFEARRRRCARAAAPPTAYR